jgi:hypothetical protein
MNVFWDAAFNKSWLLVTEEMVVEMLGYKKDKNTMSHFYSQRMEKDLEKGSDYQEVDENHELCSL